MEARRRLAILGVCLGALGAGSVAASATQAPTERQCGGVQVADPEKNVSRGRAPLAIGDSPMLLALPDLAAIGYKANARGCRQYAEGLDLIRHLKREGKLPRLVVIALGSNGSVLAKDIRRALRIVGRKRTLGLVTPRETGGGSSNDAVVIREKAAERPNRIVLLDWVEYSAGHSSWFQPDGLHLTYEGAEAFARLLKRPLRDLPPPNQQRAVPAICGANGNMCGQSTADRGGQQRWIALAIATARMT